MAQWRPFGASNKEGTCVWCGQTLRFGSTSEWMANEAEPRSTTRNDLPGGYADGFFCGLRCAYQFAVREAQLGARLTQRAIGAHR